MSTESIGIYLLTRLRCTPELRRDSEWTWLFSWLKRFAWVRQRILWCNWWKHKRLCNTGHGRLFGLMNLILHLQPFRQQTTVHPSCNADWNSPFTTRLLSLQLLERPNGVACVYKSSLAFSEMATVLRFKASEPGQKSTLQFCKRQPKASYLKPWTSRSFSRTSSWVNSSIKFSSM